MEKIIFGGCPNKYRDRSGEARNYLGVSEIGSEHLWMATELIGINQNGSGENI